MSQNGATTNGHAHNSPAKDAKPFRSITGKSGNQSRVYTGDCREIIPRIRECRDAGVDLVFADPPFNWNRAYDKWDDSMHREDYLKFTREWLDACIGTLAPHGAIWVNIPDDTAAEIVVHLKSRGLFMVNWCVWHYRFGQNVNTRFINSKVHALYFGKLEGPRPISGEARFKYIAQGGAPAGELNRVWNPEGVLEVSDRRAIYGDARTESKSDGMPSGMRLPMDVWYGKFWGRIQGNNKERCPDHDNQLPEVYLERVVRACSDEGMLVMDPFLGSGTTGVVAHALGRNFIGIEYSEDNAQRTAERIKRGPIRELNGGGQSTAIFPQRVVPRKKRARRAKTDPGPTLL